MASTERIYIVEGDDSFVYNRIFIVKAKTKKEAINKVFDQYGKTDDTFKRDYKAYRQEDYFEKNEDVAVIL